MYSRVLDHKTFSAVVAAAPTVPPEPRILARQVLQVLLAETYRPTDCRIICIDGQTQYALTVKEITERIPGLGTRWHQVGAACADLGLLKYRTRDGYTVFWNRRQVEILEDSGALR